MTAVYVRIFASDLIPFDTRLNKDGKEKEQQLSHMYGRTFAISSNTTLEQVFTHACKFWGVVPTEYTFFYEKRKKDSVAEVGDQMDEKVSVFLDFNIKIDGVSKQEEKKYLVADPGRLLGSFTPFYLGKKKKSSE